jgi:hypothetical protein
VRSFLLSTAKTLEELSVSAASARAIRGALLAAGGLCGRSKRVRVGLRSGVRRIISMRISRGRSRSVDISGRRRVASGLGGRVGRREELEAVDEVATASRVGLGGASE